MRNSILCADDTKKGRNIEPSYREYCGPSRTPTGIPADYGSAIAANVLLGVALVIALLNANANLLCVVCGYEGGGGPKDVGLLECKDKLVISGG